MKTDRKEADCKRNRFGIRERRISRAWRKQIGEKERLTKEALSAMQLGLSTAAFYGRWETEESAAQMARWGVDCVEVFLETYSEYTRAFGTQVRRALCGIPCTSIHPQGTQFENGLTGR